MLLFLFEIVMILALLVIWLCSDSIRQSKSLIVLFFYSFPSEFLIGLIPHEPVLLYYGKFYSPFTVAIVSVISTVLAEGINYSVFRFVSDTNLFEKMQRKKSVRKTVELFNRAPFIAILVAGFTPIPFFPVRFLVVMGHYPVLKYMLGVFVSRAPRFYLLALIGYTFKIPGIVLIILFIVLIITAHVSIFGNLLKKEKPANQ
ncbi:MAG: VTT domain-containing protein [Candidatus Latescibacteria bacterium]|nr:VTT domain-containing protein [Candidatus Latescibacterota bacterium]